MKPQTVRLLDVFVFGPLMIYAAKNNNPSQIVRDSLLLVGWGTIIYNGMNYVKYERSKI